MGNSGILHHSLISIRDFYIENPIGNGGLGRVWKITHKITKKSYAMKQMQKDLIISKNMSLSIMNELLLLTKIKHPLIANLHYAFQDKNYLFLVLDYMPGGDLRYFSKTNKDKITKNQVIFIAASIVLVLEYLHSRNIIHRDLKPDNLVFDDKGYLHLIDFGSAKLINEDLFIISGTTYYMAPEAIFGISQGKEADFYSLGVILFELIQKCCPYVGTRDEIKQKMTEKQVKLKNCERWPDASDFIHLLLRRKIENRLGTKGIEEVKEHKFFREFEWDKLLKKEMSSPFLIKGINNFEYQNVMNEFKIEKKKLKGEHRKKYFAGYIYDERYLLGAEIH